MNTRTPFLVLGLVAASVVSGASVRPASAQASLHPSLFALPASLFPFHSRLVRSGVESNGRLQRDDAAHFGLPPATIGRLTGYYTDVHEVTEAGQPSGYISYLISIFATPRQARDAYSFRWDTWFDAAYYTTPPPVAVPVGDRNSAALFRGLAPDAQTPDELFFQRGAILVEVFDSAHEPGLADMNRIALALDAIAIHHRRGF